MKLKPPLQNANPIERKKYISLFIIFRALEDLDEEIKCLTGNQSGNLSTEQGNSTVKKRKGSDSMSFSEQADEEFSEIEIKIKEELSKD